MEKVCALHSRVCASPSPGPPPPLPLSPWRLFPSVFLCFCYFLVLSLTVFSLALFQVQSFPQKIEKFEQTHKLATPKLEKVEHIQKQAPLRFEQTQKLE